MQMKGTLLALRSSLSKMVSNLWMPIRKIRKGLQMRWIKRERRTRWWFFLWWPFFLFPAWCFKDGLWISVANIKFTKGCLYYHWQVFVLRNLNLMSDNVICTAMDRVFFAFFGLFMNIVCVVLTFFLCVCILLFSSNDSNFTWVSHLWTSLVGYLSLLYPLVLWNYNRNLNLSAAYAVMFDLSISKGFSVIMS